MVGHIQDELERMIAKVDTAKIICDSDCSRCTGDERLYSDLGLSRANQMYSCPVGYGIAERTIEYALKDPSDYQSLILSTSRNLQKNSTENVNPTKIQSNLSFLRAYLNNLSFLRSYLNLSKQKKHESITTNETGKPSETAIPLESKMPKIFHISSKARSQLRNDNFHPLF